MYSRDQIRNAGRGGVSLGGFDLLRRRESGTLDVVFCRAFTAPHSFQLAELDSPNSQLFLNTRGNDYYQRGIPGVTHGIEDTASLLMDVAAACGADRIRTMGVSMGGYAALLFGHLAGADAVYACAPRLSLGRPECRSWRWNRARVYHPVHRDLVPLLPGLAARACLVFPAFDIMDCHDIVLALGGVGAARMRLVRDFHPCGDGLDWAAILASPEPVGFADSILGCPEHGFAAEAADFARLARAYTAVADGRFRDALALLGEAASRDPDNAGVRYQTGMMHALLGDTVRASAALRGALPGLWDGAEVSGGADPEEGWRSRVSADFGGLVDAADRTRLAGLLPLLVGQDGVVEESAGKAADRKHALS